MPTRNFFGGMKQIGLVIGLTLLVVGLSTAVAYGQTPQWSEPVRLSNPEKFAWFPDIITDLAGGIHVVWASGRKVPENRYGGYDTVIYCQPTPKGCPELLEVAALEQFAGEFNTRPAGLVDNQGILHVLWRGETVIYYTSTSVAQSDSARNWTPRRRISSSNTAYYLNIAQDQKGVLHVVWSENMPQNDFESCKGCSDIFYRQSTDLGRTWSTPVDLSNTGWSSEKPHLIIGSDGLIYVAWEEGHDFYIGKGEPQSSMFVASHDGGLTWEEPTTFIFPGDTPQSIGAGLDGQGKLVVVWQQVKSQGIFYQVSVDQGKSWSIPKQLPGIATRSVYNDLDDFDITADSAGHLHLVLVGRDAKMVTAVANQPDAYVPDIVYHLEWDGTGWSEANPIFVPANGDLPEWPRIAVSQGNQLYAIWFTRDKKHIFDSDGGLYQVWYARGKSSAPSVQPITWPTPTPSPTSARVIFSTPTPAPTDTPTPIPTLDPSLSQIPVPVEATTSIYADNDEVLLFIKSLIPSVVVIIIIIGSIRFWRR